MSSASTNKKEEYWTRNKILLIAFVVRVCLILYALVHDYVFEVSFTDIDYVVFSDAARHVANGGSPYDRATYRYTPFLAMILVGNQIWKDFGKLLFCTCDIIVAWLCLEINEILAKKSGKEQNLLPVVLFWLANPLTAVISARGSSDSIVCLAVLLVLLLLLKEKIWLAALANGLLAIHLKIYPVIYLPSIYFWILTNGGRSTLSSVIDMTGLFSFVKSWISRKGLIFVFVSLSSFALVVALFWNIYGDQFLEEFLLYHVKRRDIRHNFSPYFYLLYLVDGYQIGSKICGFVAFLPQIISMFVFAFSYYDDLPFCWFMTTFAFVSFNKVSTSQYFIWYIVFLPLIANRIQISSKRAAVLISIWFISQGIWLFFAYLFEFRGYNTLAFIWISSLLFLLTNCIIMRQISSYYNPDQAANHLKAN
ncbi:unnamed protein product, partial [Mesorhabditis belari]|uniref:GPI alpha-1,4-mannosyltransferase I, catalytic subunit n=1 Tax=Mesorhabditis belari TaxID=2138241 RepID=A0AAF3F4B0_9BILA